MPGQLAKLLKLVDSIADSERDRFVEFDPDDIKAIGPAAVLIALKGEEHWLPFSQLRAEDGQLYASTWILDKKGIEL
jgi:hypothetical protein